MRWPRTSTDFRDGEISVRFEGISGRIDQGAGILFNLKPNGDYLTVRANPLENNLVLWKFEKGKRSSVKWIRNTPTPTRQWHDLKVRIAGHQGRGLSRRQALPGARTARAGFGAHRPVVQGRQPHVLRRLHGDAGRLIDGAVAALVPRRPRRLALGRTRRRSQSLRGACGARLRRRLCRNHPAGLSARDRVRSVSDRAGGHRRAVRLGRHDLGRRVSGSALPFAHAAARVRGLDGADRSRDPRPPASRLHRPRRLHRHDESDDRRHRRARPARTSRARAAGIGRGAHAHFRALQFDRRAVDRSRRARGGRTGPVGLARAWAGSARCRSCSTSTRRSG